MRDLAVQSANDSNDTASRNAIAAETTALSAELDRIADKTTFNNVKLLDGNYTSKKFQVGYAAGDTIAVNVVSTGASAATTTWANGGAQSTAATATFTLNGVATTTGTLVASRDSNNIASQLNADTAFKANYTARVTETGGLEIKAKNPALTGTIAITGTGIAAAGGTAVAAGAGTAGFNSTDLGLGSIDLTSQTGANTAIGLLDTAIKAVSTSRANLGALQNRFEHTINNLNVTAENLTASESRIRDTDMAMEMTNFSRTQILSQAGTSMLAQANQSSQSILKLLG
jgi:flagellin